MEVHLETDESVEIGQERNIVVMSYSLSPP